MGIKCCNGCVAPKRHIGCHADCPEYISEKAKYELEKESISHYRQAQNNLYTQREKGVRKALKGRRKRYG